MKVLYIGGYSRSGSTMLLRVLGEATGTVAIGELIYIFERGFVQDQLCGCGERFRRCPFWNEVSQAAFGVASDKAPGAELMALQHRVLGYGAFPALWVPALRSPAHRRELAEYGEIVGRMYRAIAEISGAHIVIDSSKVPQFARLLTEVPGLELHVAHLVRDSRGSAYSWQRKKVRTEVHWTTAHMDRHSLLRSSVEWDAFNVLFGVDRKRPRTYTLIRYEDLVGDPGPILADLAERIGEPSIAAELRTTREEVSLEISHTVAGNPSRFSSGRTKIVADQEWQRSMPAVQRLLVTAVTAPLLRHYRYPLQVTRETADPLALPGTR